MLFYSLQVGCHWSKVAERLPNKTEGQCKSFYFNFKKKYKLDDVVAEYRKNRGRKNKGLPSAFCQDVICYFYEKFFEFNSCAFIVCLHEMRGMSS